MTPDALAKRTLSIARSQRQSDQGFVWVKGDLIGKGTFGRVYLALNATTGDLMAVKQVKIPDSANGSNQELKQAMQSHYSEVETMKDLDHVNIVQYLGYEVKRNVANLFLEYVPGGAIGNLLRRHGRFEEPDIKWLSKQIMDGLSYLHRCGILHRDLKADNILLDLDGIVKISDFGISKRSGDIYANNAEMSMQGTIFWMAPEVINNVRNDERMGYSAKVDIWSVGCVILEVFAGRRPWSNDEAIGAMYKLGSSRQAPPIPDDTKEYISSVGKEFIGLCFTINPEKRPTADDLLKHPFCEVDSSYDFSKTKLAEYVRFNDRRREKKWNISKQTEESGSKS
ncbi:hypothetical protein CANCADRAFT_25731 [Tortispora caseinolytica NRRL Y-17796]|uniref:Protein kinase domain-containing protein n=1 Tax=Tortispora caseinolytica NRRL Y-17796 TaxID=767744 RepID=A0A1E4TDZ2_9ASCO|nr:hypothetical protein CANCADRAFT_25731 [Tortispora caseinolytica NRRL Y-17796]